MMQDSTKMKLCDSNNKDTYARQLYKDSDDNMT